MKLRRVSLAKFGRMCVCSFGKVHTDSVPTNLRGRGLLPSLAFSAVSAGRKLKASLQSLRLVPLQFFARALVADSWLSCCRIALMHSAVTTVVASAGKVANENDDATALEVREIDVPRTNWWLDTVLCRYSSSWLDWLRIQCSQPSSNKDVCRAPEFLSFRQNLCFFLCIDESVQQNTLCQTQSYRIRWCMHQGAWAVSLIPSMQSEPMPMLFHWLLTKVCWHVCVFHLFAFSFLQIWSKVCQGADPMDQLTAPGT